MRNSLPLFVLMALIAGCASSRSSVELQSIKQQVMDTERAFAQTMADRDHGAFTSFLSEETVFFSDDPPLRGKEAVAEAWKRFFESADAPFSWEPDRVEVLDSGTLALTTGPVYDPAGNRIARFTSVWRRERGGQWRIIFDNGSEVCDCHETTQ